MSLSSLYGENVNKMLVYKNFSLIKPHKNQKERILKVIDERNGSVFHETSLNKIIASNFKTDLFYLVDDPNNISVLAPVHKEYLDFGLKRYHLKPLYDIPYAGFVGEDKVDFKQFSTSITESISYVGFPNRKEIDEINDVRIGETSMIDLSLSEEDIFSKIIHSKRRNMIRKSIKKGITIKSFFSEDGLDYFWPILKDLHDKLGYHHLSYDYYKNIFEIYSARKQAFILIAYKNDIAISGVLILGNKNYMHYYKGASVSGVENEGQGELLQWEAIRLSKALGAKYYDLCNLNKEKLPEIYRFKTGISKNIYQYPMYTKNGLGYKIINRLCKIL